MRRKNENEMVFVDVQRSRADQSSSMDIKYSTVTIIKIK